MSMRVWFRRAVSSEKPFSSASRAASARCRTFPFLPPFPADAAAALLVEEGECEEEAEEVDDEDEPVSMEEEGGMSRRRRNGMRPARADGSPDLDPAVQRTKLSKSANARVPPDKDA